MDVTSSRQFPKDLAWEGIGLAMVSAGALCFEINLTRLFSVSQFYHFAFMVVSMALLGYGTSGTILALIQKEDQGDKTKIFSLLAACSAVSMLGSFLLVNHIPFDSYQVAVDPSQLAILLLHYVFLSSPFFFSGMVISLMLRKYTNQTKSVYALNLVGSAAGCLLAVITPRFVGGEGVVALSACFSSFGGIFLLMGNRTFTRNLDRMRIANLIIIGITLILAFVPLTIQKITGEIPQFFILSISPYKSLSYALQNPDAKVIGSQWNSISRIDVVESPSLHSVPGLSYRYLKPLPSINGLFIDGDNLNAILPLEESLNFADYLQSSICYHLQENPKVLILAPKGGMEIRVALALGAKEITAVESNPSVIEAADDAYTNSKVNLVLSSGRSYLQSSDQKFDILQLPLTDSYHPVGSGAYSLGEDYRYTVQSFEDMIDNLKPDGILVITRWLQEIPSEWLRTFTLAVTVLEGQGLNPETNIIAFRGYNTGTLLVKKSPFDKNEIDTIRTFADEKAFDLVAMPTLNESEVNKYNVLPEPFYYTTFKTFLSSENRQEFYKTYPYDVTPPRDDHPFFGHYFKWSQIDEILSTLGTTWQPFGGAGYLVILIIFILALILTSALILLPLTVKKQIDTSKRPYLFLIYFGLIGLAFMLVEMPLIQHFILFLDQPTYAMAAVLFFILLFSGIGSHFGTQKLRLSTALVSLFFSLFLFILFLPGIIDLALGLSLPLRLGITMLLIAPLGFLMGIPFSAGLNIMQSKLGEGYRSFHWMVSYVWAVNGAFSVIASILASLFALSFGFNITLGVGTTIYIFAYLIIRKIQNL